MRKNRAVAILGIIMMVFLTGCGQQSMENQGQNSGNTEATTSGNKVEGTQIELSDNGITVDSTDVAVTEDRITILDSGVYVLTGTWSNGGIVVDAGKKDKVELVLNGVDITCQTYAPIQVLRAEEVTIRLAEGSVNVLTDGESYELTDEEDNTDAVIFSKDDLRFTGTGSLYINGNYNHGIVGKDYISIESGTYEIQAKQDGINANDGITIDGGSMTISVGDDGIHADERVVINAGEITILESTEGIEGHQVIINDGIIDITASDDGVNSNSGDSSGSTDFPWDGGMGPGQMMPNGQMPSDEMTMPDDRMPSNGMMMPEGEMPIDRVEMPEGQIPQAGEVPPNDMMFPEGEEPRMEFPNENSGNTSENAQTGQGRMFGGDSNRRLGAHTFSGGGMDTDEDSLLQINGGSLTVNAGGDGLDSNGYLEITGGTIWISGAASNADGGIDYGIAGTITGGTIMVTDYRGMGEQFGSASQQYSLIYYPESRKAAGTQIILKDSKGNEILSWSPAKEYDRVLISAPELKEGESYTLEIGEEKAKLTPQI